MYDSQIAGFNYIWVQVTLTDTVMMFERVGLQTNLGKTKEMMLTMGLYWGQQGKEAYMRKTTGEGAAFGSGREPLQGVWW